MSTDTKTGQTVYRSAGFEVFPVSGCIAVGGQKESVALVTMKVFAVLLEHPGEVVSRNDFYRAVWGEQIVSDDALTRCISDLRQLLARFSSESLIETLPKRGYRWLAPVDTSTADSPALPPSQHLPLTGSTGHNASPGYARFFGASYLLPLAGGLVAAMAVALVIIGVAGRGNDQHWARVAVIPLQAEPASQHETAAFLDDLLRQALLESGELRFVSDKALQPYLDMPYAALLRDLNVPWVVEGQILDRQPDMRITLSLVDARTSLVMTQQHFSVLQPQDAITPVKAFVSEIEALVAGD